MGSPLLTFLANLVIVFHVGRLCCGVELEPERFISWRDFSVGKPTRSSSYGGGGGDDDDGVGRVIVVSKDGTGQSRTVQEAVDLVPHQNKERVKIFISSGVYREQVVIPYSKPYISFIGNQSSKTIISWNLKASDRRSNGETVGTYNSASVAVESDYFCATEVTFENSSPEAPPGAAGMQAVALRVTGDKAMFFRCRILGFQDTLFDHIGRHFFSQCYIRGSIDFIFGSARSLYQDCTIDAIAKNYGAIAASQRKTALNNSGFSFLSCKVTGSGMVFLGRAWGEYSRVIYAFCQMDSIVMPEGWNDWGDPSRRRTALFGEFNCTGAGANLRRRVHWTKSLTYKEAKPFLDQNYIDGKQWLRL